ncbi:hypothetical protein DB31_4478 [Hyalangium minutum]|uniref:Uncharacterized protein n=1 Tax=Hyalangium minutum TaxID=394096 RepID=A0A085W030_9BACT|nr:hypothetical protein DB31_4478 [Hyalangium minutum]
MRSCRFARGEETPGCPRAYTGCRETFDFPCRSVAPCSG